MATSKEAEKILSEADYAKFVQLRRLYIEDGISATDREELIAIENSIDKEVARREKTAYLNVLDNAKLEDVLSYLFKDKNIQQVDARSSLLESLKAVYKADPIPKPVIPMFKYHVNGKDVIYLENQAVGELKGEEKANLQLAREEFSKEKTEKSLVSHLTEEGKEYLTTLVKSTRSESYKNLIDFCTKYKAGGQIRFDRVALGKLLGLEIAPIRPKATAQTTTKSKAKTK